MVRLTEYGLIRRIEITSLRSDDNIVEVKVRYCYNEKLNSVKRIISDIDSDIGVFDASYTLDERQYEYSGALTDVYTYEGRNKIMEIVHKMVLE